MFRSRTPNWRGSFILELSACPLHIAIRLATSFFFGRTRKRREWLVCGGPNTVYGPQSGVDRKCHVAFAISLDQLFATIKRLSQQGIETFGFGGGKSEEPSVIGWMPSAQIYFRDPDGHTLEFISILPEKPRSDFTGTYSQWKDLFADWSRNTR